ncbi:MAG: hypothetical protein Q9164_003231 [Protoblastenia rupestris]
MNRGNTSLTQGYFEFYDYLYYGGHPNGWPPLTASDFLEELHDNISALQSERHQLGIDEPAVFDDALFFFESENTDMEFEFMHDTYHTERDLSWRDLYNAEAALTYWADRWRLAEKGVPNTRMELRYTRYQSSGNQVAHGQLEEWGLGPDKGARKAIAKPSFDIEAS